MTEHLPFARNFISSVARAIVARDQMLDRKIKTRINCFFYRDSTLSKSILECTDIKFFGAKVEQMSNVTNMKSSNFEAFTQKLPSLLTQTYNTDITLVILTNKENLEHSQCLSPEHFIDQILNQTQAYGNLMQVLSIGFSPYQDFTYSLSSEFGHIPNQPWTYNGASSVESNLAGAQVYLMKALDNISEQIVFTFGNNKEWIHLKKDEDGKEMEWRLPDFPKLRQQQM